MNKLFVKSRFLFNKTSSCLTALITQYSYKYKNEFSHLLIINDNASWSLDQDAIALKNIVNKIGYNASITSCINKFHKQCVHYTSQYAITARDVLKGGHKLSFDYYHGLPSDGKQFQKNYSSFVARQKDIDRLRVTNSVMYNFCLEAGFDKEVVRLIPIGVDLNLFNFKDARIKLNMRHKFKIPESAYVIGSFQKDGIGWGPGLDPKPIKGPDIFIQTIKLLKRKIPNLYVFLTGPARGYVKANLSAIGVPFRHIQIHDFAEISNCYHAIDLYLITSRVEGGPKAVLESMASGVPLVTTRVGQAIDLVKHEKNAFMSPINDVEGLAHWCYYCATHTHSMQSILKEAYQTAILNSYSAQFPHWLSYFKDLINVSY